jgi:hypothetical protein
LGCGGFGALVVLAERTAEGGVGESGSEAGLGLFETGALAVKDEFAVVDESHAVAGGESFCTLADEIDVRTLVEYEAGSLDGIAKALDAGDAAGAKGSAVHEEGVKLDPAIGGEEAAAAGVKGGVVFEDGYSSFNCVRGRASPAEDGVTGFECALYAAQVVVGHFGRDGPGSAVDEERRFGGTGKHVCRTKACCIFPEWNFRPSSG